MFCSSIWTGSMIINRRSTRGYNYAFKGIIFIENESYNKNVGIHYELGGRWQDIVGGYSYSLLTQGGSRVEAWEINDSIYSTTMQSHIRFASFCHNLDGDPSQPYPHTHWDNNNGSDYVVPVIV